MNWEAVGAVGEIIGAAAVVITLAFLVLQMRKTNQTALTESLNTALGTHVHLIAELTATDDSAELFRRFCDSFLGLSLNECGRMHAVMLDRIASFNQVARLHDAGLLDDGEFGAIQGTFVSILRTHGGREWWAAYRHMVPEHLNERVTAAIDDPRIDRGPMTEEQPWLFDEDVGRGRGTI
ncbi:MAG: hypothetical protein ACC682_15115 [Gemmatimonadota bacterium]